MNYFFLYNFLNWFLNNVFDFKRMLQNKQSSLADDYVSTMVLDVVVVRESAAWSEDSAVVTVAAEAPVVALTRGSISIPFPFPAFPIISFFTSFSIETIVTARTISKTNFQSTLLHLLHLSSYYLSYSKILSNDPYSRLKYQTAKPILKLECSLSNLGMKYLHICRAVLRPFIVFWRSEIFFLALINLI